MSTFLYLFLHRYVNNNAKTIVILYKKKIKIKIRVYIYYFDVYGIVINNVQLIICKKLKEKFQFFFLFGKNFFFLF